MKGDFRELRDFVGDLLRSDPSRGVRPLSLAVVGAAVEGVGLVLLAPIIAVFSQAPGTPGNAGHRLIALVPWLPPGKLPQALFLIGALGALLLLRSTIVIARDVSLARLQNGFLERTRMTVLERVAGAGWERIAALRHGRVAHLLSADFHACAVAGTAFVNLCLSAILLATLVGVALILSPLLAVTMLALLALLALIVYPSVTFARSSGADLAALSLRMTSDLGQFLNGLKPALASNLENEFVAHIRRLQKDQARQHIAFARKQSEARAATLIAAGIVGAAALAAGGLAFDVGAPSLLAMLVVLARLSGPSLQFQQSLQLLQHSLPTYARVKALERELAQGAPASPRSAPPPPDGGVTLRGVTYLHSGSGKGVRALDLAIAPGTTVALMGESGSGKTTLTDLLAGLLVPQSGTIAVGGAPLTPANAAGWRDRVAYVPQDSFLLNDTIHNNLLWGAAETHDARIAVALQTTLADAVVAARPTGLETVVGERGTQLSGGERQRIALARALLRQPRLMLLDEATNALDPAIERRVLTNLLTLPDRPTIVVVSHRPGVLDLFDFVYRMEAGLLIPSGGKLATGT